MSPPGFVRLGDLVSFPRVSGDEPAMAESMRRTRLFSPRERG